MLEPVTVTGAQAETAAGPFPGYAARLSATGTKTEPPNRNAAIDHRDRRAGNRNAEVSKHAGRAGLCRRRESRRGHRPDDGQPVPAGFRSNQGSYYRDGSLYTVNIYNGRQEPYGLERIEFLKGASSVLYGAMPPGGVINTVSKRPTVEPLRELNVDGQLPSPAGVRRLRRRAGSGWHLVLSPDRAQARQRYLHRPSRRSDLRRAGHQVAAERGDLADIAGRIPARPDGLRLWPAGAGHGAAEPQRPHPAQPFTGEPDWTSSR